MKAKALATGLSLGILCALPGCHLWRKPPEVIVATDEPRSAPEPPRLSPPEPEPEPSPPARNPPVTPNRKLQTARPVPGKPGYVFSPFNNKIIDVKGIASGALVADPTYPAAERMHFRVP